MLSRAAASLTSSATLTITAKAKKMASEGESVVGFAAGQPDFDTPEIVKEAAKRALDEGFTKYTPVPGIIELKQAVVKSLAKNNNLEYSTDQVMISNGAKQALFEAIYCLCQKNDEVVVPAPYWVSYPEMVKASGAKMVKLPLTRRFRFDMAKVKSTINARTKVFILNSPCNPTGMMYPRKELEKLAEILLRSNAYVISDECYDQFYYTKDKPVSFASLSKKAYTRTITINAVSKTYAMTGWRIGYAAGDEKIIKAMGALQSHLSSNPCSFAQKGAVAALTKATKFPKQMLKEFVKRREVMVRGLENIPGIEPVHPKGSFYVWARIKALDKDSMRFATNLLLKKKVALIPGAPFAGEGYVRLSFACSMEQIKEGLKRIKEFVKEEYA